MDWPWVFTVLWVIVNVAGWASVARSPRPGSGEEDTDQLGE